MHKYLREHLGERCTDEFVDWLIDIGYFECPAAKSHHGNHQGGLLEHCIAVAEELQNLTDKLELEWSRPESPWVVGLLHDICKTDDYKYDFSVSDEIKYEPSMPGHGDKSVIMLENRFPLTLEESMCIKYHMGAFVDKSKWGHYSAAVSDFPNVLYTHTADMIASQIKGV